MFERRVLSLSRKLGGSKKTFFVLTHKRHVREVYFRNTSQAIAFMRVKFRSPLKFFIYFLIQLRLLQFFLRKVKLSGKFGDVIFVGGQIKSFDVGGNVALSFPLTSDNDDVFLAHKRFQRRNAREGFSTQLLQVDRKVPFSVEELVGKYKGRDDVGVFRRLHQFYRLHGFKKVTLGSYVSLLKRKFSEKKISDPYLDEVLEKLLLAYGSDHRIVLVRTHGDFSREQILVKDGKYLFTDWSSERNLIIRDLAKYQESEEDFMSNKLFVLLLNKFYSSSVRRDVHLYLVLNELYSIYLRNLFIGISRRRIDNSLKEIVV